MFVFVIGFIVLLFSLISLFELVDIWNLGDNYLFILFIIAGPSYLSAYLLYDATIGKRENIFTKMVVDEVSYLIGTVFFLTLGLVILHALMYPPNAYVVPFVFESALGILLILWAVTSKELTILFQVPEDFQMDNIKAGLVDNTSIKSVDGPFSHGDDLYYSFLFSNSDKIDIVWANQKKIAALEVRTKRKCDEDNLHLILDRLEEPLSSPGPI